MKDPVLFQSLNREEKVEFFINCQKLLIENHPESGFIFTQTNVEERKSFFKEISEKYNGYSYLDDNICLLFNKIKIDDPRNPAEAIKLNKYKGPNEDYNAYIIDFVVFKELANCLEFCKAQYNAQIKYIIYVKKGEIKLYETDKLLSKLSKLPNGLVSF